MLERRIGGVGPLNVLNHDRNLSCSEVYMTVLVLSGRLAVFIILGLLSNIIIQIGQLCSDCGNNEQLMINLEELCIVTE